MSEHPEDRDEDLQTEGDEPSASDADTVVPADQTAPGLGDVEIGGESLDP